MATVRPLVWYLGKLFGNTRIARYLSQNHSDIFREFQAILEGAPLEA
jgi:hypothetical protein